MSNKNEHMVPIIVKDMGMKLSDRRTHPNERENMAVRLEAVMNYCEKVLDHTGNLRRK